MSKRSKQRKAEKLEAFNAIVSEYEGALLRYATRLLRDHNLAQDIVQDTFIKLFKNWDEELKPSPRISSWLYRVAHNRAVDYMRKETRRRNLHEKQAKEKRGHILPDRGEGFRISEEAAKAADALNALSVREQQLVILKVYEEKSYKEISEISGLTVSNVGYILHHAMKKLAAELRKKKAQQ